MSTDVEYLARVLPCPTRTISIGLINQDLSRQGSNFLRAMKDLNTTTLICNLPSFALCPTLFINHVHLHKIRGQNMPAGHLRNLVLRHRHGQWAGKSARVSTGQHTHAYTTRIHTAHTCIHTYTVIHNTHMQRLRTSCTP